MEATFQRVAFGPGCPTSASKTHWSARPEIYLSPTPAARSLSICKMMWMSDQGAENVFARLRWPTTDGRPVCPDCGCTTCYDCRRGAYPRWRCKACGCDFSVTSGTLFAWRKLPLKTYLLSIVVFCNEVKGKSQGNRI